MFSDRSKSFPARWCSIIKSDTNVITWKSGDVHLWQIPGLEDDYSEAIGSWLIAQRNEQLTAAMAMDLQ